MEWIENVANEIGGCRSLIESIVSRITLNKADPLSKLLRSKGVILHGKPGVGKTALATSISSKDDISIAESDLYLYTHRTFRHSILYVM